MFTRNKTTALGASLLSVAVLMSGCSSESGGVSTDPAAVETFTPVTQSPVDVSDASIVASAVKVSGGNIEQW